MYDSFIIGIDISSKYFDVAYMHGIEPMYLGRYINDMDGFRKAIRDLKKHTDQPTSSWFMCFENTGVYSKGILQWLASQGIPSREESALKISKSMGMKRGKSDEIDAKAICRYAFEKRDTIQPTKLSSPIITQLKHLLARRDLLVRQCQSFKVSLSGQASVLSPQMWKNLKQKNDQIIQLLSEQIKDIEKQINDLLKSDKEIKKNDGLAQSVVGIGLITSAYMIAYTENFTCFSNGRKFASYAGTAPFPNESGIRKKRRSVHQMGNKKIKSLLSNGVQSAILHDPEIRHYFQAKTKHLNSQQYGIVYNAIKNKLIHRVFAVIKRQTPYAKLGAYA